MPLYIQDTKFHLPDRVPDNLAVIEGSPIKVSLLEGGIEPEQPNYIQVTGPPGYRRSREPIMFFREVSKEAGPPRMVQTREELDILLVRGSEITRSMPPGHLNAIFLKDCQTLETDNYMDAIKAAIDQGAFVFWNHPGWTGQQPDGVSRWYEDHTTLYEKGWLHGIEVVNFGEYYPEVHDWCNEKKLTFIGSSDVHSPINLDYNFQAGEHRPMTLVFAEEWTLDALKEALFEQRTVVYVDKRLIGADSYLKPIFDESIQIRTLHASLPANGSANIQIHNSSGITFELFAEEGENLVRGPQHITLYPGKTVIARIRGTSTQTTGVKNVTLPYRVQNLLVTPEQGLSVELQFTVTFIPRQD